MRVAPYTSADEARLAAEPEKAASVPRGAFARDRARVLHSAALRRLAGKTQVVGVSEPDVPRTRLTHSLEVAQVGRELGHALGCDPDLVDLAGLAHDLGHPPFGHNGEAALDALAGACGGFEGNAQTLRELTRLEVKVLRPDGSSAGLNLTRAALDATAKYPWRRGEEGVPRSDAKWGVYPDDEPVFAWLREGAPPLVRCLEAQVMDWADDVAYSVHDLEDGVLAGLVDPGVLGDPDEADALVRLTREQHLPEEDPEALREQLAGLRALPYWPGAFDASASDLAALKRLTSELIARFTSAALQATRDRSGPGPRARYAADLVVPAQTRRECALLKAVTARYVMEREGATALQARQRQLLQELVAALLAREGADLDPALRHAWRASPDDAGRLRAVLDQVARLPDAAAVAWHARLVGPPA